MRLDPSHIGDPLRQLGGGAADAASGQQAARHGDDVQDEAAFESLDSLLLKRLRAATVEDAAASVNSFADALALLDRTRQLQQAEPDAARSAQGDLARERLRDLLGEG